MRKSVLLHYYHTCERTYLSIHPQPFPSHCRRNEPKLLFIVRLVARAPALSLSILAHPLLEFVTRLEVFMLLLVNQTSLLALGAAKHISLITAI